MKKILFVLLFVTLFFTGCQETDSKIPDQQFIEITSAMGETVGIIEDEKEIRKFTTNLGIEDWEYIRELPDDSELKYIYATYAVVDDPIFLKDDTPVINKGVLKVYSLSGEWIIQDDDGEFAKISNQAGEFLANPVKMNISNHVSAEEIISDWGMEFEEDELEVGDGYEDQDEYYAADSTFTEKDLKRTSKEHRLEVYNKDTDILLFETVDVKTIANYLNSLEMNNWKYIDQIPEDSNAEKKTIYYQQERYTNNPQLIEMYTQILYSKGNDFFIREVIPGDEEEIFYQVPLKTGEYIINYNLE